MADERIKIINAPAGSGKTTQIEKEIKGKIKEGLNKKILCLTYTNRAVEELKKRIDNKKVDIYTIHSFLQKETKLIFYKEEVIKLYCEIFNDKIAKDIGNADKLSRYKEKKQIEDEITIDTIENNIKKIKYNERNYSRYLYGELSHDDLLMFVYEMNKKFEYFKVKINGIYDVIYLDEYQDTNKYILNMIKDIVEYKNIINWKLYGDNMQKIYNSENTLEGITDSVQTLKTNYRSSNQLIKLLNNIYNQPELMVNEREGNEYTDYKPILRIYNKNSTIEELKEENSINLSSNYKDIYKMILGNDNLSKTFSNLKREEFKIYGFTSELTANDLLMNINKWENDILLKYLEIIFNLHRYYNEKKYGKMFEYYKNQASLNKLHIKITTIVEKKQLEEKLKSRFETFNLEQTYLVFLTEYNELFTNDIIEEITDSEINYRENIENIKIKEIHNLYEYIINPNKKFDVSTQHGVKGESHYNVNLICENNTHSNIDYKYFFEIYCNNDIDISELEKEYYKIRTFEEELSKNIGGLELKPNIFNANINSINEFKDKINSMKSRYLHLFLGDINVSNASRLNNLLKGIKKIKRYIITFKIFYVGCSRAREKLIINVKKDVIASYEERFKEKFKELGFEIEYIN